jgi:LacI family transcriptional regulator
VTQKGVVLALAAYASLKDVGSLAQVSFQTAGKVLNGASDVRVSSTTAERIFAAAEKLHYRPNALARSLLDRATGTIGLLIADVTDAVSARVAVGVQDEACRRGLAILLASLPARDSNAADMLRMLLERRVDGVILESPHLEEDHDFAEVARSVPAVVLQHVLGGRVPFIGSDDRQAGRIATEHLLENGHRLIGSITGPYRRRAVRSRLLGYEDALRGAGAVMSEDLVAEADWSASGGAWAIRILLEREPRITAVFVHSDEMAIGVLRELRSLGKRVPDDVAIIGCDDLPFAELLTPSLSSVRVPFVEIGREAVTALVEQIAGRAAREETLLPVSVSARESSIGPVPKCELPTSTYDHN